MVNIQNPYYVYAPLNATYKDETHVWYNNTPKNPKNLVLMWC